MIAILLSFTFASSAKADPNSTEILKKTLPKIGSLNKDLVDYKAASCTSCEKTKNNESKNTTILNSQVNQKKVEVSVITLDQATKFFNDLLTKKNIPFKYLNSGSEALAHLVGYGAEYQKIIMGKIFVEGEKATQLEKQDQYHVASIFAISTKDGPVNYVIDPSYFDKLVTEKEWKEKMEKNLFKKIDSTYYTNRFIYYPNEKLIDRNSYDEHQYHSMNRTIDENKFALRDQQKIMQAKAD
jgi:hypothetical protein